MAYHMVGKYDFKELYGFEELPKGPMFKLAMNPYTGMVLIDFEKHESSTRIAYEVLSQLMEDCRRLERLGFSDPLRKYAELCDSEDGETVLSSGAHEEQEEKALCSQE